MPDPKRRCVLGGREHVAGRDGREENQEMRRTVIRIATGLLFVLCCFFLASIINDISASMLTPSPTLLATPTATKASPVETLVDRQQILERNLFGSRAEPDPIVTVEVEPEEDLEATRLPVKLLGTVASADPKLARAAIANRNGSDHQLVQIGDALEKHPQATVVAIHAGRVVLQNGPRREELSLSDEKMSIEALNHDAKTKRAIRGAKTAQARPSPRVPAAPRIRTAPNRSKVDQLQKLAELANQHKQSRNLLSNAKLLPKFEDKNMIGVELSSIESESFLGKLGLKDGDLISEVNGVVIDNPKAGQQVLNVLTQNQKLTAVVNGKPLTVSAEQLTKIRQ